MALWSCKIQYDLLPFCNVCSAGRFPGSRFALSGHECIFEISSSSTSNSGTGDLMFCDNEYLQELLLTMHVAGGIPCLHFFSL